ncbi:thioredoxin-like protein [Globomyces pollinis-pini]|nr:thioredoxin-like protein [Globomyces pollinis-pini]
MTLEKETTVRTSSRLQSKRDESQPKVVKKTKAKAPKKAKVTEEKEDSEEDVEDEEKPAKLKFTVGEKITSLTLLNEEEEPVDLLAEAETHGLVIFFYPRASTPGCTVQGCLFRDEFSKFEEHGYKVFGCSADSPKSQKNFRVKQNFNYPLLSDKEFKLIGAIGAKAPGNKVTRSHIVIGKGGVLLDTKIKISPKESAAEALSFIESL